MIREWLCIEIKERGSILCGTCSYDVLDEYFCGMNGETIWFHSDNKDFFLTVIGVNYRLPCFGDINNRKTVSVDILVNRFIERNLCGNLYIEISINN